MKRLLTVCILISTTLAVSAQPEGITFGLQLGAYAPTQGVEDDGVSITAGANVWVRGETFGLKFEIDSLNFQGDIGLEGEEFVSEVDIDNVIFADATFNLSESLFLLGGVHWVDVSARVESVGVTDSKFGYGVGVGFAFTDHLVLQGRYMLLPGAVEDNAVDVVRGIDDSDFQSFHVTFGWQF